MQRDLAKEAIVLAKAWQKQIQNSPSSDDKFHYQIKQMLESPQDKYFMMELLDQSFRSDDYDRVKEQMVYIFKKYGVPHFLSFGERCLVYLFLSVGKFVPQIAVPLFIRQIMSNSSKAVLSAQRSPLDKHLKKRQAQQTRINLNLIGEVVLGEEEAIKRTDEYIQALKNPLINYVSIKISTIYSQINVLDFEGSVEFISKRLSQIYQEAINNPFTDRKGHKTYKFINLDMEEYRDLALTVAVFIRTLDKPAFKHLQAGIVLQAYLPDSFAYQKQLTKWAKQRVEHGGAKIKIRLVKGANKEMEETEASLKHWALVTYSQKCDTDANYKRMLEYGLSADHAKFVDMGVASHNLFESAYGYIYAKESGTLPYMSFEMLEGMNEKAYELVKSLQEVILYAPAATKENFTSAIAYLFRRLDENTSPDNFMRYVFDLEVDSPEWERLQSDFLEAFAKKEQVATTPNRVQNRLTEHYDTINDLSSYTPEADTDFILPQNRKWAEQIKEKWKKDKKSDPFIIPVVYGGEERVQGRKQQAIKDKNQDFAVVGNYCIASAEDIEKAITIAQQDPDGWRKKSPKERSQVMGAVANAFRNRRGDLIGVATLEVGKVFTETDVEVSEAVDFVNFYAHSALYLQEQLPHLDMSPKGVGLIVPPWNFPIAIPTGGIAAALAAGNTVIIKPSSNAVACAYELCQCFWQGGISKNTLQFIPCSGEVAGDHLIPNKAIDFVILTGGEDTAYRMQDKRPELFLSAETGGKNAIIVTRMADKEKAILDIVQSAFLNSGQKCSACSLLILEKEVYDDKQFKAMLIDATKSLSVGSAWDFHNRLSTLANPISDDLRQALTQLQEGEEWALAPQIESDYLLHPCIKYGVKQGSFSFMTEFFAPLLSVVRADSLHAAIDMVNSTGYGLTSGLHSLDEREIEQWKKGIKAGNLYINRTTTGAIVRRQPFGGMGKSAIGMGRKVGIYNYITQFMNFTPKELPKLQELPHSLSEVIDRLPNSDDKAMLKTALFSYIDNLVKEFNQVIDFEHIRGEDNHFRYIPINRAYLRVSGKDSLFDILARVIACRVVGVAITISIDTIYNGEDSGVIDEFLRYKEQFLGAEDNLIQEDENDLANNLSDNLAHNHQSFDRLFFSPHIAIPQSIYQIANRANIPIINTPPLIEGRIELLNCFLEQSISHSYHRHGNLGKRSMEGYEYR